MKLLILLSAAICVSGCIRQPVKTVVPLAPESTITVILPRCDPGQDSPQCTAMEAHRLWMKAALELHGLILDEYRAEHKAHGQLDTKRRDRIAALAKYLKDHKDD